MTSSKKTGKSSSFKKAYGQDYTAGQGLTKEQRINPGNRTSAQAQGELAVETYNKLKGKQTKAAKGQKTESNVQTFGETKDPKEGQENTILGESVQTATAQQRGAATPSANPVHGEKGPDTAEKRTEAAQETAKTGAETSTKDLSDDDKEDLRAESDEKTEEAKTRAETEAKQKYIEEKVAEERKKAALEKRQFNEDEYRDKVSKEYDDNKAKEAEDKELQAKRNKVRNEKFREEFAWATEHGWDDESAKKWAMDKANKYADKRLEENFEEETNPEAIKAKEEREARYKKIREESYDRYLKEAEKKGMDPQEAKAWAMEQADKDVDKQTYYDEHEKEFLAQSQARAEAFGKLLNSTGSFLNGLGKAGEYTNKGLDIAKGVLNTMMYPSPLGTKEAQTMIAATAEAMNIADELVKTVVAKGNEHMGKKIVNNMTKSMGDVLQKNFGGKDINELTGEEMELFMDDLGKAWAPFVNKLSNIGADNPVGKQMADKFLKTYGMIDTAAKSKKREVTIGKREKEGQLRVASRQLEEKKEAMRMDTVKKLRDQYKEFGDPNSPKYSPRKKLFWDLAEREFGKMAIDPETGDPVQDTQGDAGTFSWMMDPKMMLYDEAHSRFIPSPQMANRLINRISTIKSSMPDTYALHENDYEALAKQLSKIKSAADDIAQQEKANAKWDAHMAGAANPDESTPVERFIREKEYTDKNFRKKLFAGRISLNPRDLDEMGWACTKTINHFYDLGKGANGVFDINNLSPDDRNKYIAAKNTQDVIVAIKDEQEMEKQLDKIHTVRGPQRFKVKRDAQGNTVIDPSTGKPELVLDQNGDPIPILDALGRPTYDSVPVDPERINEYKNRMRRELERMIKDTDMYPDDYANDPAGATRTYQMKMTTGNIPPNASPGSIANARLYREMRAVQRDMRRKGGEGGADLPDIVGDPMTPYAQRVGAMDYIRTLNGIQASNVDIKDFMRVCTNALGKVAAQMRDSLKNIDEGAIDPATGQRAGQGALFNNLASINTIAGQTKDMLDKLPANLVKSPDVQAFVTKSINEMAQMIDTSISKINVAGLPQETIDDIKGIAGDMKTIISDMLTDSNFTAKIDNLARRVSSVSANITKASKAQNANRETQTDRVVDAIGQQGQGQPQTQPKSNHQLPDNWGTADKSMGTYYAWNRTQPALEAWPSEPTEYWAQYDKLLGVIAEADQKDTTIGALQDLARKAFIRGIFGDLQGDKQQGVFATPAMQKDLNGGASGELLPAIKVKPEDLAGKAPTDKVGLQIPDPSDPSKTIDLTVKDYKEILKTIWQMEHGGSGLSSTMWMAPDITNPAIDVDTPRKFMGFVLNLAKSNW